MFKQNSMVKLMVLAVARFVKFLSAQAGDADKLYTSTFAPVLIKLFEEFEVADVKDQWSELNVAAYAANKVVRGDTQYNAMAKRASMLLQIGLVDVELLQDLIDNYTSLQGVYVALKGSKKGKKQGGKKLTFRDRVINLLAGGTRAQRRMVQLNIKAIVRAASEK